MSIWTYNDGEPTVTAILAGLTGCLMVVAIGVFFITFFPSENERRFQVCIEGKIDPVVCLDFLKPEPLERDCK